MDYITVKERVIESLVATVTPEEAEVIYEALLAAGLLVSEAAVVYLEDEDG
jgi:hypothetical protein